MPEASPASYHRLPGELPPAYTRFHANDHGRIASETNVSFFRGHPYELPRRSAGACVTPASARSHYNFVCI